MDKKFHKLLQNIYPKKRGKLTRTGVCIRVRIRFWVMFRVRVRVKDRVRVGMVLGLGCGSLYQYSGGVWAEIFPL